VASRQRVRTEAIAAARLGRAHGLNTNVDYDTAADDQFATCDRGVAVVNPFGNAVTVTQYCVPGVSTFVSAKY
jgi:hypothetical protein